MTKTINHWIGGQEVAGKGTRKSAVFNPATGEQTARSFSPPRLNLTLR